MHPFMGRSLLNWLEEAQRGEAAERAGYRNQSRHRCEADRRGGGGGGTTPQVKQTGSQDINVDRLMDNASKWARWSRR